MSDESMSDRPTSGPVARDNDDDGLSVGPVSVHSLRDTSSDESQTKHWSSSDGTATVADKTASEDPPIPEVPRQIGRFEVREELGRGGFGVVHRAYDPVLDRDVAIKAIARNPTVVDDGGKRLREGRAAARMSHPYLVPVYEIIESNECIYLVSELCPGPTLRKLISAFPNGMETKWGVSVAIKLAQAISHAHRRGFVHRDIKPSNVLLVPDPLRFDDESSLLNQTDGSKQWDASDLVELDRGESLPFTPRLTDFGLMRDIVDLLQSFEGNRVVGTLPYIAPEQLGGQKGEGEALGDLQLGDVYSLGVVIYQMLTGCVPYSAKVPIEMIELMSNTSATPVREKNPAVNVDLNAVCMKCLERDPRDRYQSIDLLLDDLERYAEGFPVDARPQSRAERMLQMAGRSPVETTLVVCLLVMSTLAAITFAWSNRSLRKQGQVLADAMAVASHNETLAKEAEARASEAFLDAEQQRINAVNSENTALEIAYESDLRDAFSAVSVGNSANALQIVDDVLEYCGEERVRGRTDWQLINTLAKQGWDELDLGDVEKNTRITGLALVPKRNLLVSTSLGGCVRFHDLKHGELVHSIQLPDAGLFGMGGHVQVHALAASSDGRWIAVGKSTSASLTAWTAMTSVELLDLSQGDLTELTFDRSLMGFDATVESLAFTPDCKQIAVGCRYEPVRVISLENPMERFEFPSERRNVTTLINAHNELVYTNKDREYSAFDLSSRRRRFLFGYEGTLGAMDLITASGDSSRYCCVRMGGAQVQINDVEGDQLFRFYFDSTCGPVTSVKMTDDGNRLIMGTLGGGVGVWDLPDMQEQKRFAIERGENNAVPIEVEPTEYSVRHRGKVTEVVLDESGRIFSGGEDGMIATSFIADEQADGGAANAFKIPTQPPHLRGMKAVHTVVTDDGRFVYAMRYDGSVYRLAIADGDIKEVLGPRKRYTSFLQICNEGKWLAAGYESNVVVKELSGNGSVHELDASNKSRPSEGGVVAVFVGKEADWILLKNGSTVMTLFRVVYDDSGEVQKFSRDGSVRFRRSASAVFSIGNDEMLLIGDSVFLYRVGDYTERGLGPGFGHLQSSCRDDVRSRFLLGVLDGRIYAVNESGEQLQRSRQWRTGDQRSGKYHGITSLAVTPDGRTLLTGSSTGELGVWNAATLRLIGTVRMTSPDRAIRSLAMSEENNVLVFNDWDFSKASVDETSRLHVIPLVADNWEQEQ
ncbi:serine/threonine-protein kinase [Rhodopirellula sallentina]|uniref:Serine/threonine-protein kinase n=1 Tax=Rhodopirellula sallentina SM41 TaxID=1263870 RepID=M5U7K3_9BACT|nr:serine/threonine-protein kinase [Rhodopirellula sallentina]EMI53851.1 serine/threonine-protein kinase [Rhodopirellula sallentina SM41]